jgi:DNA-directed RNA polymerase subunit B'
MSEIYLNGKFIGTCDNTKNLIEQFKDERKKGKIRQDVSISVNKKSDEIHIESSKGRVTRPLIVVKEGKPVLTQKHLEQLEKKEITYSDLILQGVV